jgi:hypothetical protein
MFEPTYHQQYMAMVFGKFKWGKHGTITPEGYFAAKANSYTKQIEKDILRLQEYEEAVQLTAHVVFDGKDQLQQGF